MIQEQTVNARAVTPLEFVKSSKKGTQQVATTFVLTDGEDKGARIDWTGNIEGPGLEFTSQALDAMGYDGSRPDSICVREVQLKIVHDTFVGDSGKPITSAKVKFVNPLGSARYQKMDGAEMAVAKSRLAAAMTAIRAGQGKPAVAAKPDDDQPF